MAKYRKKPIVIEAFRWTGDQDKADDPDWIVGAIRRHDVFFVREAGLCVMKIKTLEGVMTASLGDWIIRGVNHEIYPCKSDIFYKMYELVREE